MGASEGGATWPVSGQNQGKGRIRLRVVLEPQQGCDLGSSAAATVGFPNRYAVKRHADSSRWCASPVRARRGDLAWHRARNNLPAMPPVDAEIIVGRQQNWTGKNLRHADEAGVGKAHRHACVLFYQVENGPGAFGEIKRTHNRAAANKCR